MSVSIGTVHSGSSYDTVLCLYKPCPYTVPVQGSLYVCGLDSRLWLWPCHLLDNLNIKITQANSLGQVVTSVQIFECTIFLSLAAIPPLSLNLGKSVQDNAQHSHLSQHIIKHNVTVFPLRPLCLTQ